jgi:hypothetical protein
LTTQIEPDQEDDSGGTPDGMKIITSDVESPARDGSGDVLPPQCDS